MDMTYLWAGLSIWIACLWVAIWQGFLVFKTMDTIGKNPKLSTFFLTITILWIALLESAAIYWLLTAFKVLSTSFVDTFSAIWVGLAIWLTGFWVWIWEGILISKSIEAININPYYKNKIMAYMILFLALIESSAIYGFVIAFQILGNIDINSFLAIWAWLAIWLAGIWVAIWEWLLAEKSIMAIWEDEESAKIILPFTILWIALIESAAIYGLIIAMQILWAENSLWIWAISAWIAVGLTWLWVALWESYILQNTIPILAKDMKKSKTFIPMAVLWVALVESSAIYGLIVAMQILSLWDIGALSIWAWLAIWLAGLWVSLWEWYLVWRAVFTAGIERSKTSQIITYMILFVALVESAAIYALIVAFQILSSDTLNFVSSIWAGLAVWLAGLGVWIWEWILSSRSIYICGKRPRYATYFLTVTILWVALVESVAIYGLIISFQIISLEGILPFAALWAWVSIWLSAFWTGIAEWYLVSGCYKAMARNPENKTKDLTLMILFLALIEVLAIYWLFMAFNIMGK